MIQTNFEQGTEDWLLARNGRATASCFKNFLATRADGAESSSRKNYRATLVLERLTGRPAEHVKNEYMEWGNDTEDLARTAYMLATGNDVEQVGFAQHDELMAGASPDGLVGKDGGIEIKCKTSANHLESLKLRRMPNEHRAQVQGNLWIFEREWWDYVSYDPRFPENAQLFIERIYRDDKYINDMVDELIRFLDEVAEDFDFVRHYDNRAQTKPVSNLSEIFN